MASRASNFCIDAHDPYAQTMWWAQVLEDFRLPTGEQENKPGEEECGLKNHIRMRIPRLACSPSVCRFPHAQAIPKQVHNSL